MNKRERKPDVVAILIAVAILAVTYWVAGSSSAAPPFTGADSRAALNDSIFHQAYPPPKLNPDTGSCECDACPTGGNMQPDSCASSDMSGIIDPVYLYTGEFFLEEVDLRIPGRGFDYEFRRTYKSRIRYDGPLGHNWQHNYNQWLYQDGAGNVTLVGDSGRSDTFTYTVSISDGGSFISPLGFYTELTQGPDGTFTLSNPYGSHATFYALDGSPAQGKLQSIFDRYGNTMWFHYDSQGRLRRVTDTLLRSINYHYNAQGRLDYVEDFEGRRVNLVHDANGDLVEVSAAGQTWRYTYSSGSNDPNLNHNLRTIIAPNEAADGSLTPVVINTYSAADEESYSYDRVIRQVWGGTNASGAPAGGTITLGYEELNPGGDPTDLTLPRNRTTLVDREGYTKVYEHNVNGHRLSYREYSGSSAREPAADPEFWETTYAYNADGQRVAVNFPGGDSVRYFFDEHNPDRLQQGNRLRDERDPGDGNAPLVWTRLYEPIFNQVISVTNPAGYTTLYGYDEWGNVVVVTDALGYTSTTTYDEHGDPISATDENGNTTVIEEVWLPTPSTFTCHWSCATMALLPRLPRCPSAPRPHCGRCPLFPACPPTGGS